MLKLFYALKDHNNWRFPTRSQPRISYERAIEAQYRAQNTCIEL
jgi:hypothetical protein